MEWSERHLHRPDASFDGGDLDCGNGLLLLIRQHIDPLERGQLLEVLSTDASVEEDLPAWSRLTGNELLSRVRRGKQRSYLLCKGSLAERREQATPSPATVPSTPRSVGRSEATAAQIPEPAPAPAVAPLSVMGIGSWPRPRWMLQAMHDYLERRLEEDAFQQTADDAVRLAVAAQERSRRRCADRRRTAPRQLCQLRRQPARQLPADSHHRSPPLRR